MRKKIFKNFFFFSATPGEASGVHGEDATITTHSIRLRWLAAPDNGSPVFKYDIEASSNLDPEWKTVAKGK